MWRTVSLLLIGQRRLKERESHRPVILWVVRTGDAAPLLLGNVSLHAVLAVVPGAGVVTDAVRKRLSSAGLVVGAGVRVIELAVARSYEAVVAKVGRLQADRGSKSPSGKTMACQGAQE
jgi:hypothetical protein